MTKKLQFLRVRPRKVIQGSPCVAEMATMLNCWSLNAPDDPKCAQTAKALAACMQSLASSLARAPKKTKNASSVNYHLARLGKLL
ncbi:mitochondrial ribosomal protein subunit Mrp10 [Thamnocephalis sphaerospora]|uniref:Mitochondrial ribosomal protein subunit Mrp10 n=1 Tax=Thamnocephalis sphaerospora TaxID=78915 RepID=A0A4P9XFR6_9FUNG|nr:mitochondrial ribosomal protein subunit Mrp10 [Thamnocephalis sphaerospora]|eukprot:RKP04398.1 mitochondrial ribosomal protein subunit Mrp10 [Thamnocephalis sphaerospora]